MRRLVLIRHSLPEIDPDVPARAWHLSEEGCRRCVLLAEEVSAHAPAGVVTSEEPKAIETGQIVADHLGLHWETAGGLHEHERPWALWEGREAFEAKVAQFFQRPESLVFGEETADQAGRRFRAALDQVLQKHGRGDMAVVSHGTVMTLLVAGSNQLDPISWWTWSGRWAGEPDLIALGEGGILRL
jgi:broad specificity phosphatase PhoE